MLFALTLAAAAGMTWLAPRPPMVDLPQHAAQVALWRDLILGRSAWGDLVHVNLLTPYLLGYGLTLPLAFVFSLGTAVRIVVSLALLAFTGSCVALRCAFGGDRRLDWLFPVGFFGFAWQWGFLTFVVASPVALLFLLAVHRAATRPGARRAVLVATAGIVLLFCHGLLFVVIVPIGAAMALYAACRNGIAGLRTAAAPFVVLGVVCLGFRLLSAHAEGAMRFDRVLFNDPWLRPVEMLLYVTNVDFSAATVDLCLTCVLFLTPPLLLRCRLNRGLAMVPFIGIVVAQSAMPNYAFQTGFLFQRFSLFLLPFYALMFRPAEPSSAAALRWTVGLPIAICWTILAIQAKRIWDFAPESRSFDSVLAAAEPNKRALSLVFDRASAAARNPSAYLHFPLWYQAEKGGFVDFNFAAFHPQVVRFRPGLAPAQAEAFQIQPGTYEASGQLGRLYDYYFVRGSSADVASLVGKSSCRLSVRASNGPWTLLQRDDCPD